MKVLSTIIFIFLCAVCLSVNAQRSFDVNLWPSRPSITNGNSADTAKIKVFLPDSKKATGRAVVIVPGGAYKSVSINSEGVQWASFFNNLGIAAIVLKYRLPNGNPRVPLADIEEAMRIVKRNAVQWKIKNNDIGVVGFSAGGHLASLLATKAPADLRPNFQILFYPVITMMPDFAHKQSHDNFLGSNAKKKEEREYSTDMSVNRNTPRSLIIVCDDDNVVAPANGVNFYNELYRHDVPASLFVFPEGGHGWGMDAGFKYHLELLMLLKAYLAQ